MALQKVITLPDQRLRVKATEITRFDKKLRKMFDDMVETMRDEPGVGLAATQIAVPERAIVVEWGDDEDEEAPLKLYKIANPVITFGSMEKVIAVEGCLSVPNYVGEVERHLEVVVEGQDPYGKPLKIEAKGWLARIFQHEMDHLDGILFVDRAERVWQPKEDEEVRT